MSLSWNEIRVRARGFAEEFADAVYEKGETQTFYNAFFKVFGVKRRSVARFEEHVRRLNDSSGFIDLFWPKVLLVEQKSAGRSLAEATQQAGEYFDAIEEHEKPRYQMVSDFKSFELLDREAEGGPAIIRFELHELPEYVHHFGFILGREKRRFEEPAPVSIKATEIMAGLHDALKESGYPSEHLAMYLVRLVFVLFADNTGIIEPRGHFLSILEDRAKEDGIDLGRWLDDIFTTLNAPEDERNSNLEEDLASLPYVNGDLFAERIPNAHFDSAMRLRLIEAARFDWAKVSPSIFGSLFQSVMDPVKRRHIGAHYTTESNIMKLIGPLFLDGLRDEFERLKKRRSGRAKQLEALRHRLASMTFFDPACGCGNFLVVAYREVRQLELEIMQELWSDGKLELSGASLSWIEVDQFYGIELESFPARIAEIAIWMTDHIMNARMGETFGRVYTRIPLLKSPHILRADALDVDWNELLPAKECSFVLGNPPFGGSKYQDAAQRQQVREIADLGSTGGTLDHVAAWFIKAGDYVREGNAEIAFVATNSICQGEQVGQLWPILFQRFNLEISFAHRTFQWDSEAPGKAHVHCVIVGLTRSDMEREKKRLFSYSDPQGDPEETTHDSLSAYLFDAALLGNRHLTVKESNCPINGLPPLKFGTQPIDGGHYIFSEEERAEFLEAEPGAESFFRPFLGAREYIHDEQRWILALMDASPKELSRLPLVRERITRVKEFRLGRRSGPTRELAQTPTLYNHCLVPSKPFLVVPEVSSERRDYVPIGWLKPPAIPSNQLRVLENAKPHHFGLLTSAMHMAWLRNIGGRLKSDYRYSNGVVYNTFPLPEMSAAARNRIAFLGKAILDARARYPESALAHMYDPDLMPAVLRKAHSALDRAVDRLYRRKRFESERERVEHLLMLYERMTAPVIEAAAPPKRRRRKKT